MFKYGLLFSLATNLMMLALPLYSLQVLERVPSSGRVETLYVLSGIALLAIAIFALFYWIRSRLLIRVGHWFDAASAQALLMTALERSAVHPETSASQPLRDLQTIKQFYAGNSLMTLLDAPWSVIYFAVLYLIHPVLCLLTFAGGIVLLAMALLNEWVTRGPLARANEGNVRALQYVETSSRNAEVISGMGMASAVGAHWGEAGNAALNNQTRASQRGGLLQALSRSFRMALQIATMGVGMYLLLNNEVSIGGVIACSILAGRALSPFEQAIGAWTQVIAARRSIARLKQLIVDSPVRPETLDLPEPEGQLQIDQVTYGIPEEKRAILRGVNCAIDAGETLGIIGPSAAGKSTLAKLIVGVYRPLSGAVRLDGADVYTWNREDFGRHVGYLPQTIELFDGTIRDNIARLRSDAEDEAVIDAAKVAGAHEMILKLPHGYDTPIGVGGANLSAGQRQRIGLARAFFGGPKLVVLDEPNANLDDEGDAALVNALKIAKVRGITVVLIAHRPSVLKSVDKILVIKGGQMVDFGTAEEIVGRYQKGGKPAAKLAREVSNNAQETSGENEVESHAVDDVPLVETTDQESEVADEEEKPAEDSKPAAHSEFSLSARLGNRDEGGAKT